MTVLGMIPARRGSKRLPRKNVLPLGDIPLVGHTCRAARASGVFNAIVVNTDDPEVAQAAGAFGVPTPMLRPAALAADDTPTRDAVVWMLEELDRRGERFDVLVLLQPTSPLRTHSDIAAALRLFIEQSPCRVVSTTRVSPRSWTGVRDEDGGWTAMGGEGDLWRLNGAIYIDRVVDYLAETAQVPTFAYAMPKSRSVDIDTQADFDLAEFYLAMHAAADPLAVLAGAPTLTPGIRP